MCILSTSKKTRNVDHSIIAHGVRRVGIELNEMIQETINVMTSVAREIGLDGIK